MYLFERKRACVHKQRGRKREKESQVESMLSVEPNTHDGLNLRTPKSQPEPKARVRHLTAPPRQPEVVEGF